MNGFSHLYPVFWPWKYKTLYYKKLLSLVNALLLLSSIVNPSIHDIYVDENVIQPLGNNTEVNEIITNLRPIN